MTRKPTQFQGVVSALAAVLLWAGAAQGGAGDAAEASPATALEQVAISGIITDASGTGFRLSYGGGEITVDMSGWRRYAERERGERPLFGVGENVTVTGMVDDALYRAKRLEALSVFARDRDTLYTAMAPEPGGPWSLRLVPPARRASAATPPQSRWPGRCPGSRETCCPSISAAP